MTGQVTTIPKDWKEMTLGEVGVTITGKTPSKDNPEDWGDFLDFITPSDIVSDSKYLESVARKLSEDGMNRFQKMIIPSGSIVVTCIGSDMGKVVINKNNALANQQINSIKVNSKNDKDYIYYFLKNSYPILRNIAVGGSTMPILNKSTFESLEISLPPLPEQRAIGAMLSSLDDKIELLREQNKTLETTAQAVFKEWFVKFNFPGATGKMVDSELGEIPERWKVGKLTEMFDFMEGPGIRNWQYTESGRRFINIRLIQNGDIDIKNSNFISVEEAETTYKHFHLEEKDMVVSTSGTLGRSAIVRKEHLPLLLNTSVIRFRPIDKQSYAFMYNFLNSPFFQNELESLASGSVQLNFGPVHLKQIEMVIPNEKVLKTFADVANPLYEKLVFNFSQIQTLSIFRDSLLPKLMKGEVRIKGFK